MLETVIVDRIITELFSVGRSTKDTDELLSLFGSKTKELFGVDEVKVSSTYPDRGNLTSLEDYTRNTGKPYVDNRLSDYSAFPELIKYSSMGYRSCALVPAIVDGSSVFVLTLLSKKEDRFDNSLIETSNLVSNMVAYQAVARAEKERSISLAKYFDAAFNSDFIQLLIDRSGVIIKANKATYTDLEKTQKEVHGKNVSDFFPIDRTALDAMAKGHSMEFYSKQRTKDIYRIACSSVSDKLLLLSAYNITNLKIL